MKEIKGFFKNYKTSLPAIAVGLLVVLHLTNKITSEQLLTAIGVLTTAGLLAAKDHSKTGE